MPETQLLEPDRAFIDAVIAGGGQDLKKCFQCATCSVACGLSTDHAPFPRKEMHWAQWGLKDRLMADPDIWLCHQCNDCSNRCPRQARPGDVLAAVRRQAIQHYAVPHRLAAWVNSLRTLPMMFLIPVVLLTAALLLRDPLSAALGMGEADGFYAEFFPHWLLISFFSLFVGL
ncbi:MAG TPA: 4Fe-4S dicluster domain-containing protein, partial [Longimicrobiales bacterium]|nr:4Fe-4S dicluster domain-containing protein [Longimicrobiales bacterium]